MLIKIILTAADRKGRSFKAVLELARSLLFQMEKPSRKQFLFAFWSNQVRNLILLILIGCRAYLLFSPLPLARWRPREIDKLARDPPSIIYILFPFLELSYITRPSSNDIINTENLFILSQSWKIFLQFFFFLLLSASRFESSNCHSFHTIAVFLAFTTLLQ